MIISLDSSAVISASAAMEELMNEFDRDEILTVALGDASRGLHSFEILSPSAEERYLGMHCVEFRVTMRKLSPAARFVVFERLPDYEEVQAEHDLLSTTIESLPVGIGLHYYQPGDRDRFAFVSEKFAKLLDTGAGELKTRGMFAAPIHFEDMEKLTTELFEGIANLENVDSVIVRLDLLVGGIRFLRFGSRSTRGDSGVIISTISVEEVSGAEAPTPLDYSGNMLLNSFVRSSFDVGFYCDFEFAILDDSNKVGYFFNGIASSVKGTLLESFIDPPEDKARFQEYLVRPLQIQASEYIPVNGHIPAASMIKLRLRLGSDHSLKDVQLYACPTHAGGVLNITRAPTYFVALRGQTDGTVSNQTEDTTSPPVVLSDDLDCASSEDRDHASSISSMSEPPTVSMIPSGIPSIQDESTSTDSESEELSIDESGSRARRLPSSRGLVMEYALLRFMRRDLFHSLEQVESDSRERNPFCPSNVGVTEWLIPLYEISDHVVMEAELVRALPFALQGDFMLASRHGIYDACSQILAYTCEGDVNILQPNAKLANSADLVHCAFRFFIGILPQLNGERAYRLLRALGQGMRAMEPVLKRKGMEVAKYEFTMALITAAIKHVDVFASPGTLEWLKSTFVDAVTMKGFRTLDKTRRLPIIYHVVILWACLMKLLKREAEAKILLENTNKDISVYCEGRPGSIAVREFQAIILYNLALLHMENQDSKKALNLIWELQSNLEYTYINFPERCRELVRWAVELQAENQSR